MTQFAALDFVLDLLRESHWRAHEPVVKSHSSTFAEEATAQLKAAERYESQERYILKRSAEWEVSFERTWTNKVISKSINSYTSPAILT